MAHRAVAARILMDRCGSLAQRTERNAACVAIVARRAIIDDADVIKNRRPEAGRRMAITAILSRRQMPCCLHQIGPRGEEAADMAAFATAGNILMSGEQKRCGFKRNGGIVANAAILIGRNVVEFFRRGDTRSMAGRAVVGIDTQMIKAYAGEAREVSDVMTRRTIEICRHMAGRLANTYPSVMTRCAVVEIDTQMSKGRIRKVDGVMAVGAICTGGYVVRKLAEGDDIVMA